MKKYLLYISVFVLSALGHSCSDENNPNSPIENDKSAPGQVYNIEVENLSGAARITYSLPDDEDLLYILARYTAKSGAVRDFRSSGYTNSIILEGFGDTSEYNVQLFAVDRSENKSQPVNVSIKPLTPPVALTAESINIKEDFGGISFTFNNKAKAALAMIVITPDSVGRMSVAETFYSSLDSAKFAVRGFEEEPRLFGIVVRDKWQNFSDTIYKNVTPIYEIKLDKSKFRPLILPTDAPATEWSGSLEFMWDGVANDKAAHTGNVATGEPKHISFDLGVSAKLSRFNLQTKQDDNHFFNDVTPRLYEIWGCETYDPSGSFDGWTKLVTVESIKPSGLPVGSLTEDDRIVARRGDEADIPIEMPKVRYIRIRCLNNWSSNTNMVVSEITLWGSDR